MTAYVLRRVLYALFVLWGALTIIFIAIRIVPGDPAAMICDGEVCYIPGSDRD